MEELYTTLDQEQDTTKKDAIVKELRSKVIHLGLSLPLKRVFRFATREKRNFVVRRTRGTVGRICPGEMEAGLVSSYTPMSRLEDGECGHIASSSEFIFGGQDSRVGEFPFTALIRQTTLNTVRTSDWDLLSCLS